MIRFIINFILFGLLFYILWRYAPDLFETLVSWVDALFEYLKEGAVWVFEKIRGTTPPPTDVAS